MWTLKKYILVILAKLLKSLILTTFFSYILRDIGNIEVFNVQMPQVEELTKLCWKFPDSRVTVPRAGERTLVNDSH